MSDRDEVTTVGGLVMHRRAYQTTRGIILVAFLAAGAGLIITAVMRHNGFYLLGLIPVSLYVFREVWWLSRVRRRAPEKRAGSTP